MNNLANLSNKEYYGIMVGTLLIVFAGMAIPMNLPPSNWINWLAIGIAFPSLVIGIIIELLSVSKIKSKFQELENKIKNKKIDSELSKDKKTPVDEIKKNKIYDTRIVAIGLGVIFGLIYLRIFENEFFHDIILVAIPSLLGLFGSKWITTQWQIKSAKMKMKKEILETFAKCSPHQNDIFHNFFGLFSRTYGKMNKEKYDFEKGSTLFELDVPLTGDTSPQNLLQEEYKKMELLYEDSKLNYETLFQSLLELYYRDNDLQADFGKMAIKIGYIRNLINSLMQDHEKSEKYKKIINEYIKEHRKVQKTIANFARKLVDSDIKI